MATNPHLDIDQKMLGDIHTSREMMDHLEILCDDFGSRFGGTEGERLAARFFRDKFKAYGLTIQYFAANERIVLLDQAKVVQEGNTFEGEKIVYDTRRQIVNAGRATNTDVSTPRPRVDMVIQPRKREQAAEQPQ